jgi:hypothetical protein
MHASNPGFRLKAGRDFRNSHPCICRRENFCDTLLVAAISGCGVCAALVCRAGLLRVLGAWDHDCRSGGALPWHSVHSDRPGASAPQTE